VALSGAVARHAELRARRGPARCARAAAPDPLVRCVREWSGRVRYATPSPHDRPVEDHCQRGGGGGGGGSPTSLTQNLIVLPPRITSSRPRDVCATHSDRREGVHGAGSALMILMWPGPGTGSAGAGATSNRRNRSAKSILSRSRIPPGAAAAALLRHQCAARTAAVAAAVAWICRPEDNIASVALVYVRPWCVRDRTEGTGLTMKTP
jgi:hypothetical protein